MKIVEETLPNEDVNPDRRQVLRAFASFAVLAVPFSCAGWPAPPLAGGPDVQPLVAQVRRLADALSFLGEPLADLAPLRAVDESSDRAAVVSTIEQWLAPRCLIDVRINPEARVSVARGAAPARLVEQGWRAFLVKVRNEAGVTGPFTIESPQARPVYRPATGNSIAPLTVRPADVVDRWLALQMFDEKPMEPPVQPRRRPARGAARGDDRQRQRGHRLPQPDRRSLRRRAVT